MATCDSAARFLLCRECRKHGIIITSNYDASIPFFSKEMGVEIVSVFHEQGIIDDKEVSTLTEQINNSPLVEDMCYSDLHMLENCHQRNAVIAHIKKEEDFCKFLADRLLDLAKKASRSSMN